MSEELVGTNEGTQELVEHAQSFMADLRTSCARDATTQERDAALRRMANAVAWYVGLNVERAHISALLAQATSHREPLRRQQQASAVLDSMLIAAAARTERPRSAKEVEARHHVAVAIHELSQERRHQVAAQTMMNDVPPAIGSGTRMPLRDHIIGALADVRVLHVGDTEHSENGAAQRWLGKPDTLSYLASSGVRHIFLERGQAHQNLADELASEELSRAVFLARMKDELVVNGYRDDHLADLREIADIVENARKFGIRVHFADPWTATTFNKDTDRQLQILADNGLDLRERRRAGDYLIEAYVDDAGEAIRSFITANVDTLLDEEARFHQRYQSHFALSRRLQELRTRFDGELAEYIHSTLADSGGKAILYYGAGHGVYDNGNDLDDRLDALGDASAKIDLYASEDSFLIGVASYADPERTDRPRASYVLGAGGDPDTGRMFDHAGAKTETRKPAPDMPHQAHETTPPVPRSSH